MRSTMMCLALLIGPIGAVAADPPPCVELPCPADATAVQRVLASAAELYGLYQFDALRATVAEDGTIPVYRLMESVTTD